MSRTICSYCNQTDHSAAHCPRRPYPSQARLNAEQAWSRVAKKDFEVVRKRKPKVDPKRLALWAADLSNINRDLDGDTSCSTNR